MAEKNLAYLEKFQELSKQKPGPIPYSVFLGNKSAKKKVFFCAATHGNEVGSIPAVIEFIENHLNTDFDLQIHIALGNIEAIKLNQRYVEEDMNRSYGRKNPKTIDEKRAKEIGSLIKWADLFVDIHQTIEATEDSFYVLRNDEKSQNLARALSLAKYGIVIDDNKAEKKDHITGTSFALLNNTTAFTIELSQKGYSDFSKQLAYSTIEKVIQFYSKNDLEELSKKDLPKITFLDVDYAVKFKNKKMHLVEGLKNLAFYKKDHILAYDGETKVLAPYDGYVFFPKYPPRDKSGNVIGIVPTNILMFAKKI